MTKKEKTATSRVSHLAVVPARRKADWQLLSGEELARPGATLINLILAAAMDRGIMADLGEVALGVSKSYFHALRSGGKPVENLGEEHIAKAAAFLQMPKVSVLLAAGRLKPEDFYTDPVTLHDYLQPALRHMQRDPEFAAYIPAGILNVDTAIQHCLVLLYERATGRTLIPGKVSNEAIAQRHRLLTQSKTGAKTG